MFDMCTFSEGMVGVFSYGGSAKMKLHDCQITNCRHVGVQAAGGQMEANLSNVVGSKDVGLLVRGDNTHVKFSMCKILDSGTWGVQTFGGSKCTLFESQIMRSGHAGVLVTQRETHAEIRGCQVTANAWQGVSVMCFGSAHVEACDLKGNHSGCIYVENDHKRTPATCEQVCNVMDNKEDPASY
mmetsp:Transcript_17713/g.42189  ORF Transcript_17713/g.42189 Transcript_17713/m.42189 type:complete len:184 (-) Transcript_17713:98-649(-)